VQPDDDIAGEGAAGVAQKARILDGRGADDDVRQARVQVVLDGVQVAYAAADLHGDVVAHCLDDGLDGRAVLGLAGHCTIEVDQVQAPGPLFQPLRGHGGGVFGKYGSVVQVALAQAHTTPVFEIYGGDQ